MSEVDPEKIVMRGLEAAKIKHVRDPHPLAKRLDFYLPDYNVFIEVKQFHSERISEQMSRADNVIAIQGKGAAIWFADAMLAQR